MDPFNILRAVNNLRRENGGVLSPEQDRVVQRFLNNNGYSNLEQLQLAVARSQTTPADFMGLTQDQLVTGDVQPEQIHDLHRRDLGRLFMQGAGVEWTDELLGDRERLQAATDRQGILGAGARVAGAVAMPVAASIAASGMVPGLSLLGTHALSTGLRTGGVAAGEAMVGAMGAGEGSLQDRFRPLPVLGSGAVAGATGGLLSSFGHGTGQAVTRRGAGGRPARRTARVIEEGSGVSESVARNTERFNFSVKNAIGKHYDDLERLNPVVDNQLVDDVLSDFRADRRMRSMLRNRKLLDEKEPVSFEQLKELRTSLGKNMREYAEEYEGLTTALEDAVPGFRTLSDSYRKINDDIKAFNLGNKRAGQLMNASLRELENEFVEVAGMTARAGEMYRIGFTERVMEKLMFKQGEKGATGLLRAMMFDMFPGSGMRRTMRRMFPDNELGEEGFRRFVEVLEREAGAERARRIYRRWGGRVALGAAAGFGAALGLETFGMPSDVIARDPTR
jgi:hypothetical protein